jgi:Integrase zinc binding domain
MKGITNSNGLLYIGSRLVILRYGDIRENLFQLTHDSLGHFGADKSYGSLCDAYYWPNMCRDLEKSYIPSCINCQRNKSRMTKPAGPLHPLPVPYACGDSITIDFIGPLPGFDMILSMTDCLGSDIRIIPTHSTISANELAVLFFDNWYCENGLPRDIVSDRDKLFVSHFWKNYVSIQRLSTTITVTPKGRIINSCTVDYWTAFMLIMETQVSKLTLSHTPEQNSGVVLGRQVLQFGDELLRLCQQVLQARVSVQ